MDHQVAGQPETVPLLLWRVPLDPCAAEGDLRKALRVEEVGAAQVRVAVADAGIDARDGNGHLDAGLPPGDRGPR